MKRGWESLSEQGFFPFFFCFSGLLASRNPNTGNNSKPIGFQNRFDVLTREITTEDFEHENDFQRSESAELFHSISFDRTPMQRISINLTTWIFVYPFLLLNRGKLPRHRA
jgi:hypothetical protein